MNRRAAVLVALAASFLPVSAPAADTNVPVGRMGAPLAGDARTASRLRPVTMRAFRVPPDDTALYVGTPWFVRDLTVTMIGPGARRRTITACPDLPGRTLGRRLPATAASDLMRRANTAAHAAKAMGRARVGADEAVLAPPPEAVRC